MDKFGSVGGAVTQRSPDQPMPRADTFVAQMENVLDQLVSALERADNALDRIQGSDRPAPSASGGARPSPTLGMLMERLRASVSVAEGIAERLNTIG